MLSTGTSAKLLYTAVVRVSQNERKARPPALSRCPTFYPWTKPAPLPSELTRAAAAATAKSSSPSLVCVPRESASPLLWQLLAGLSPNKSCATEFYIPCASGAKADIQFYIVRFAKLKISILRIAQRSELSAHIEFLKTLLIAVWPSCY